MLTSVDGGHGGEGDGGGTTPQVAWVHHHLFSYFWKYQSVSFFRQLKISGLLYHLWHGAILQYMMMCEWHHNPSWKMLSWHWFDNNNGTKK